MPQDSGTFHLEMLTRISALIGEVEEPVLYFVTSTQWAAIAEEARAVVLDPSRLPTPENFKELRVGKNLLVVNSGSEDQDAVNIANRAEAERVHFQAKRERLRTG